MNTNLNSDHGLVNHLHQPSPAPTELLPAAAPQAPILPPHAPDSLADAPEFAPIEPWPEPVNGATLLEEISRELKRFVILPRWVAELLALWILHTYAFHLRKISTYIAIESPEKECGKSTLLDVLSCFVSRPAVSANITSSAVYRAIQEFHPTLLIDEADTNLRARHDLRGILNAGYYRPNSFVWRVAYDPFHLSKSVKDETETAVPEKFAPSPTGRIARYSCWCPKAIAAIGALPDTLASRCIVFRMHRKMENESCERLVLLETGGLRRKCARFVQDHADAIASARPPMPAGIGNRTADIWEPLFALADIAGGHWPDTARQACLAITAAARNQDPRGVLLVDLFVLFGRTDSEKLLSREIVEYLNRMHDRPWMALRKGKAVNELWLASQLRSYGVRPRTLRLGEEVGRGYTFEDLKETWRRYMPRAELDAVLDRNQEEVDTPPSPALEAPPAIPAAPPSPASAVATGASRPPVPPCA